MERKDWVFEFEKGIKKIKNSYDKLFIRWQETFVEEKRKQ